MIDYIKKNFIHREVHEYGKGLTSYIKVGNQYYRIVEILDREDQEEARHLEFIEDQLAIALNKMFNALKSKEFNDNNKF